MKCFVVWRGGATILRERRDRRQPSADLAVWLSVLRPSSIMFVQVALVQLNFAWRNAGRTTFRLL